MTFGTGTPSCIVTSMFEGLMSRWMMPFWCACWTAWQTLDEQLEPRLGVEPLLVAVLDDRDALDVLHHEVGPPRSVLPASSTLAMFGWSIIASA